MPRINISRGLVPTASRDPNVYQSLELAVPVGASNFYAMLDRDDWPVLEPANYRQVPAHRAVHYEYTGSNSVTDRIVIDLKCYLSLDNGTTWLDWGGTATMGGVHYSLGGHTWYVPNESLIPVGGVIIPTEYWPGRLLESNNPDRRLRFDIQINTRLRFGLSVDVEMP